MTPERPSPSGSRSQALDSVTASTAHELSDLGASLAVSNTEAEPQVERALEAWGVALLPGGSEVDGYRLYDPARYPAVVNAIRSALLAYPPGFIQEKRIRIGLISDQSNCGARSGGLFTTKTLLLNVFNPCKDLTLTVHHELMHFIDAELDAVFRENFPAEHQYHGDAVNFSRYARQPGFADPYCQVSIAEDIAQTSEALWNDGLYRKYRGYRDDVVDKKLMAIATFYRGKGIRAPNIDRLLGPETAASRSMVSSKSVAPMNRTLARSVEHSPMSDFLGRTERPDGWYVFHWRTQASCQSRSGGQGCQPQPDGTYVYYQRKADVDRVIRR